MLGVGRSADEKEIKRAFRTLARKYHPDANPGNKEAEKKFKEISEAYEVLRDPEKRAQYDRFGRTGAGMPAARRARPPAGAGAASPWEASYGPRLRRAGLRGMGGCEDLLGDLLGRSGAARRRQRGRDITAEIELTLHEAYTGVTRHLTVPMPQVCPRCHGRGTLGGGRSVPPAAGRARSSRRSAWR